MRVRLTKSQNRLLEKSLKDLLGSSLADKTGRKKSHTTKQLSFLKVAINSKILTNKG